MIDLIVSADWSILHFIQDNIACDFLDVLMPKITALGNAGIIWLLWAVVLIFIKRYRKYGIILLIALLAGLIIGNGILKNIVERPRPCWLDESVVLLIQNPKDFSFP